MSPRARRPRPRPPSTPSPACEAAAREATVLLRGAFLDEALRVLAANPATLGAVSVGAPDWWRPPSDLAFRLARALASDYHGDRLTRFDFRRGFEQGFEAAVTLLREPSVVVALASKGDPT